MQPFVKCGITKDAKVATLKAPHMIVTPGGVQRKGVGSTFSCVLSSGGRLHHLQRGDAIQGGWGGGAWQAPGDFGLWHRVACTYEWYAPPKGNTLAAAYPFMLW